MNVAFQGVHGAYSEAAARTMLGDDIATSPCETFGGVFDRVESRRSDRGVIPIENSLAGSIHENYDLLLSRALHIVGEVHERIEHALLCPPGGTLGDLTSVRSHPQALAQCSKFLLAHPAIRPVPFFDTAGAASAVARDARPDSGAIAGTYAARLYGLRILKRNIENSASNYTRHKNAVEHRVHAGGEPAGDTLPYTGRVRTPRYRPAQDRIPAGSALSV